MVAASTAHAPGSLSHSTVTPPSLHHYSTVTPPLLHRYSTVTPPLLHRYSAVTRTWIVEATTVITGPKLVRGGGADRTVGGSAAPTTPSTQTASWLASRIEPEYTCPLCYVTLRCFKLRRGSSRSTPDRPSLAGSTRAQPYVVRTAKVRSDDGQRAARRGQSARVVGVGGAVEPDKRRAPAARRCFRAHRLLQLLVGLDAARAVTYRNVI